MVRVFCPSSASSCQNNLTIFFVAALDKYPGRERERALSKNFNIRSLAQAARSFFPHSGDLIWWDLGKQQRGGGAFRRLQLSFYPSVKLASDWSVKPVLSLSLANKHQLRVTHHRHKVRLCLILSVCCVSKVLSKLVPVTLA